MMDGVRHVHSLLIDFLRENGLAGRLLQEDAVCFFPGFCTPVYGIVQYGKFFVKRGWLQHHLMNGRTNQQCRGLAVLRVLLSVLIVHRGPVCQIQIGLGNGRMCMVFFVGHSTSTPDLRIAIAAS